MDANGLILRNGDFRTWPARATPLTAVPLLTSAGAGHARSSPYDRGFPARRRPLRHRRVGAGGAGAAATKVATPEAAAAAPMLTDYAMRQIPAATPCGRLRRGDQLCLAVAARLQLRGQADHPALRRVADRRRTGHREQLPVRQAGRHRPVGLHSRVRRRRRRRENRLQLHTAAGVARAHRSSSPSTTTSAATPGTPSRCSGSAVSTRFWACSAPGFTAASMCVSGPSPTVLSGIPAHPAAGGPGRPGRGPADASTPRQFSTNGS